MIRIGVNAALSTIQSWTWLLGALPRVVNRTIKAIRVEVSPTNRNISPLFLFTRDCSKKRTPARAARLFRNENAGVIFAPAHHESGMTVPLYSLRNETYRPHMYTLYTQAPTDSGGGVFVRTGTRFQATEKTQWLRHGYGHTVYRSTQNLVL